MTFSIRTFLIVIAVLSVWLGALVSKSPLLVELATSATVLLILLSLALAIWEPRPLQRAFWTGFFALAFGNLIYNGFFNPYQQMSNQVAQAIMGKAPSYQTPYGYSTPTRAINFPPSQTSFYAPEEGSADQAPSLAPATTSPPSSADEATNVEVLTPDFPVKGPQPPPPVPPSAYPVQMPSYSTGYTGNYYEQREAIRASVPALLSLLMGVIGGCVTMWIASRPKPLAA